MRDIVDEERRANRPATAVSPAGCGRRRIVCEPPLLDDEPHRLRRGGSHTMRRRTQRNATYLRRTTPSQTLFDGERGALECFPLATQLAVEVCAEEERVQLERQLRCIDV